MRVKVLALPAALLVITSMAQAGPVRLYCSGSSDGTLIQHYRSGPGGTSWSYESELTGARLHVGYWGGATRENVWEDFYQAVLQMPISSLEGVRLAWAKLWFYAADDWQGDSMYRGDLLYALNYDGAGVSDWAHISGPWTQIGRVEFGPAGWHSVDVTVHLQSQVDASFQWAGYVVRGTYDGVRDVYACEDTGGRRPYLEVLVPEPSSLVALAGGLAGFSGLVIRRKRK